MSEARPEGLHQGEAAPADPPTPERASILVVDDERANLMAMEALLAPLGRRVVVAGSGEEALRILLRERFAVVLLDVQMPGMDGFETARLIRGRLRTRRIPIIFVTAVPGATSHMFDGYAAGAVDYLLRPVDPVILRSKVTLFAELFELNARLQRQAERRGMEESLALAQRAGLSGVWDWHLPSDGVRWSREYADLVGLADAEGDPRAWLAPIDARDRERVRARIATAIAAGGTWEDEFRVVHPRRGLRWLSARGRVYRDADGAPERFIGIAMDVTERHRAEEELRWLNATGERLATALTRSEVVAEVVRQASGLPGVERAVLLDPSAPAGEAGPAEPLVSAARAAGRAQFESADDRARVALPLGADGTVLALDRATDPGGRDEHADAGFLAAFAAQCAQALERARLHDAERLARRETEALQSATEALAAAGARQAVADTLVREAIRTFGAAAAGVRMLLPDGRLHTVAVAGFDCPLARPAGVSPLDEDSPTVAALAGAALFAEDRVQVAARHPDVAAQAEAWPGLGALAALPLQLDDRAVGVLGLRFQGPRAFRPDERNTLRAFARLGAMSLVRAELHESEARGRAHADLLADVSAALDAEPGLRGRIERLRDLLVPRWADGCVITATGSDGRRSAAAIAATDGALEGVLRRSGPWTASPAEGVLLGLADDAQGPFTSLVRAGVVDEGTADELADVAQGVLVAPIAAHGRGDGAIALAFREHPGRLLAQLLPAEEIGRRVGIALENARLFEAQVDVATTLQRSLLPAGLPDLADVTLAARYQTATEHTEAGGDWYEAVELPGGRVFLAVGDVVGRGTVAASVMGQLRAAMRAYALGRLGPKEVLEHLSRFASGVPGAEVSTAVCVEIDPARDRIEYACAGHPYPLIVDPDGSLRVLRDGRGPALGVTDRGYSQAEAPLPSGATLLLFTDGLVERRTEPLDVGLERLGAAAAEDRAQPVRALADRIVERLVGEGSSDDVALLVARRERRPDPLELDLPATPESLSAARAAVRDWLAATRVDPDGVQDVVLAAGEALANAVEHGAAGDPSTRVRIAMRLDADRAVWLRVSDDGRWRRPAPDPGLRGQGIRVMRAVMDDVHIDRADGTIVTMVRRPRAVDEPGRRPRRRGPAPAAVAFGEDDEGVEVAVVSGEVDAAGAALVDEEVRCRCAADADLHLEMSDVTYLDSSGARFLAELARRQRAAGGSLTVHAPPRGPVARLMELTGLAGAGGIRLEDAISASTRA